jgi:hypothetical protein
MATKSSKKVSYLLIKISSAITQFNFDKIWDNILKYEKIMKVNQKYEKGFK